MDQPTQPLGPPAPPLMPQGRPGKVLADVDQKFLEKTYNPDQEFVAAANRRAAPFAEFMARMLAEKKPEGLGIAEAHLFEVDKLGQYRIRHIRGADADQKFLDAYKVSERLYDRRLRPIVESGVRLREVGHATKAEIEKRLALLKEAQSVLEADSFDTGDPDFPLTGNDFIEYLPMLGGPFSKQLYLHDFLDMHRKAFEAWNHNPVAHQIVKITTFFVLGRGVSWKACHPECQEAFDLWAKEIDLSKRLEFWSDTLTRDGELMVRKYKNPISGRIFVRWIDPSTIWEIVTDPEDIERVFYYHQQYPTQYQVLYGTGSQLAPFKPQSYQTSKYVINQIPADQVLHYKINCSPNEKRGRSDLFSILGWLKRHKDFWTAYVLRSIMQATYAWKNKLKGADTDVNAFISQFGTTPPPPGSVWVENEASELTPMTLDIKGEALRGDNDGLLNMIAVGVGIPKEYLGLGDQTNRASAVVSSEPGVKKFQARQQLFHHLLEDLATEFFAAEMAAGKIPAAVPDDSSATLNIVRPLLKKYGNTVAGQLFARLVEFFTGQTLMVPHKPKISFNFPEIASEDRSAKLKDLQVAQDAGWFSLERAGIMAAKELGAENYNFTEEREKIRQEQDELGAALYQQFTTQPGRAPGPGPLAPPKNGNGGPAGAEPAPPRTQSEERRALRMQDRT